MLWCCSLGPCPAARSSALHLCPCIFACLCRPPFVPRFVCLYAHLASALTHQPALAPTYWRRNLDYTCCLLRCSSSHRCSQVLSLTSAQPQVGSQHCASCLPGTRLFNWLTDPSAHLISWLTDLTW